MSLLARFFEWFGALASHTESTMNVDQACARHLEICRFYDGCDAEHEPVKFATLCCPSDPTSAEFFLHPHDDPKTPQVETPESSCGAAGFGVVMTLLRELGFHDLDHPIDFQWYARDVAFFKKHNAYRTGGMPTVNSLIHVTAPSGAQHYRTVASIAADGLVTTYDGGQKTLRGYQRFGVAHTTFEIRGGEVFDTTAGKFVTEWFDVRALLAALLGAGSSTATSSPTSDHPKAPEPQPNAPKAGSSVITDAVEIVDVSSANGPISVDTFAKMRDAGIVGVIVRLTKGRVEVASDTDALCFQHANNARTAGLEVGGYSLGFGRHGRAQDGREQARDAVAAWRSIGATLLLFQDREREKGDERVTEQEHLESIQLWADEAELLTGKPQGIYCGPGWWELSKARMAAVELARCPLWSSDFEASRPIGSPLKTPPWASCVMHQYAGSATATGRLGTIPGVPSVWDRSRLFGGLDSIRV